MKRQKTKTVGPEAPQRTARQASRRTFFTIIAGASLAAPLLILRGRRRLGGSKPAPEIPACNGPWGRLEITRLLLEKPAEMLPDAAQKLPPIRWQFPALDRSQTIAFLKACGLTESQRGALTDAGAVAVSPQGCVLTPPPETVLALSAAARQQIYAELAKCPANVAQQHPFCIRLEDADLWFSRVGLPQDTADLLMGLTYRSGNALCFSDTALAQQLLAPPQFCALIRALYSTNTVLLRLRVQPGDPIDSLAAYWGRGGRAPLLRPMIQSLAGVPQGASLEVAQLLPPLPRAWLCAYPDASEPERQSADCYYSSLNFFRTQPEIRFLDPQFRSEAFRRDYDVVPKAEQLGDIIVFADGRGVTQHACVYIAGDFVFTKNGAQPSHPWVFMHSGQVSALYARETASSQVIFRKRAV